MLSYFSRNAGVLSLSAVVGFTSIIAIACSKGAPKAAAPAPVGAVATPLQGEAKRDHLANEFSKQTGYQVEFLKGTIDSQIAAMEKLHSLSTRNEIKNRGFKIIVVYTNMSDTRSSDQSVFINGAAPAEQILAHLAKQSNREEVARLLEQRDLLAGEFEESSGITVEFVNGTIESVLAGMKVLHSIRESAELQGKGFTSITLASGNSDVDSHRSVWLSRTATAEQMIQHLAIQYTEELFVTNLKKVKDTVGDFTKETGYEVELFAGSLKQDLASSQKLQAVLRIAPHQIKGRDFTRITVGSFTEDTHNGVVYLSRNANAGEFLHHLSKQKAK